MTPKGKPKAAQIQRQATSVADSARKSSRRRSAPVAYSMVDGYKVFPSPVQPVHRTAEEIAQAVAELD